MIKVIVPGDHGHCKESFQGTSAAAPIAAGLIALLLEVNSKLTWRDVQHIIVRSSRIPTTNQKGWMINAAGFHYHSKIGFGIMDCGRMVALAQNWTLVGPYRKWYAKTREKRFIYGGSTTIVVLTINNKIPKNLHINTIEQIIAIINIHHLHRRNVEIHLTSPSNTISQLLSQRPLDNSKRGFRNWKFKSVHFWGENPNGEWTLEIRDSTPYVYKSRNFIDLFALKLYGTSDSTGIQTNKNGLGILDERTLRSIRNEEVLLSQSVTVKKKLFELGNIDDGEFFKL